MQENGFWEGRRSRAITIKEILAGKSNLPSLISVSPQDKLMRAVSLIQEFNISQLPVIENKNVVGSLNEASLMQLLHDGIEFERQGILTVMGAPLPSLDESTDISEAYRVLLSGATGIVVKRQGLPIGLITRADLLSFWLTQKKEDSYEISNKSGS